MAKNHIVEMLQQIRSKDELSELDRKLTVMLEEKQKEMGDDPTEEETAKAVQSCMARLLSEELADILDDDGDVEEEDSNSNEEGNVEEGKEITEEATHSRLPRLLSEALTGIMDNEEFMKSSCSAVREVFKLNEWTYREEQPHDSEGRLRNDITIFELAFKMKNCSLRMRVYVEYNPRVCRIDAIMPISADKKYAYLLCHALANENYSLPFGAFQYDELDGEVVYRYSYPITAGLRESDFLQLFLFCRNTADDRFKVIRKHCVGKYKRREVNEILERINDLVDELSDE